jgi:hypothetical protein
MSICNQVGITGSNATDEQINRLLTGLAKIESGQLTFSGFTADGKIIWKK